MILKVNDSFITVDITVERQSKVFDSFSETAGDYSYQFQIPNISEYRKSLRIQNINQPTKQLYNNIPAEILTDEGIPIYYGSIKVESIDTFINASFFSGNTNWIKKITGSILDFDYSSYDVERTYSAVISTWSPSNTGVIFPFVDRGNLENRIGGSLANNVDDLGLSGFDFHPFFFVKTIFKMIFDEIGVKVSGDLISDAIFNSMIVTSNRGEPRQSRVDDRTAKAGRTSSQSINTTPTKLVLDQISDGANDLYDPVTSTYTADASYNLMFTISFEMSVDQAYTFQVYKNGSPERTIFIGDDASVSVAGILVDSGDQVEYYLTSASTTANLLPGSEITMYPGIFSTIYAADYLPEMDKSEFVSNIFKQLNILTNYDPFTKTVTTKYFDSIAKNNIDLSQYINSYTVDYFEFISSFAKRNNFVYAQSDVNEEYDSANDVPSGNGVIKLNNDYIEDSLDVVDVTFSSPRTYLNPGFNTPIIDLGFVTSRRFSDTEFQVTSVTDNGGIARFNVPGAMPVGMLAGRVIEIFDSSNPSYNGTGVILASTSSYFELVGVRFINDATASFTLSIYEDVTSDSAIIALVAFADISEFTTISQIYIGSNPQTTDIPYAYFDKPSTGLSIDSLRYSLSFDPINQIGSYQISLIDRGYNKLERILNDPVKIYATCFLPLNVFLNLSLLESVRLSVNDFTATFYINRITGYKNSYTPCILELIKLS